MENIDSGGVDQTKTLRGLQFIHAIENAYKCEFETTIEFTLTNVIVAHI